MVGKSVLLPFMTYEAIGMRPTHGLPSLGLSTLAIYRTHNTTSRAKTQATKDRGRHGIERVMMMPELFAAHSQPNLMSLAREHRRLRRIPTDMFLPG
jgi:hypothetical protein